MDGPDSTTVSGTYVATARAFAAMVARIPVASYDGPGLGDWDLRALVGHTSRSVVTVLTYLDRPATEAVHGSAAAYYAAIAGGSCRPGRACSSAAGPPGSLSATTPLPAWPASWSRWRSGCAAFGLGYVMETIVGPMRPGRLPPDADVRAGGARPRPRARDRSLARGAAARRAGGGDRPRGPRWRCCTGDGGQVLLALTGRAPLPEGFSVV